MFWADLVICAMAAMACAFSWCPQHWQYWQADLARLHVGRLVMRVLCSNSVVGAANSCPPVLELWV